MNKLTIVLISITLLLFFVAYQNFRLDDTFIFYTYAKNIADGNGYVFNIGEKVNATTSPLYTLLLAFLYLIIKPFYADSFVLLGNLISTLSIGLIFYCMKKIIRDNELFRWFAMIFLAMPLLKFGFGMETFLNLSLITYSVYFFTKEKYNLASFFVALSVLARIDSILFAATLFIFYIYKHKKLPDSLMITIFLITLVPWFTFSKLYFNSFLPTTVAVKLAQSDLELFGPRFIFLTESVRVIPGGYLSVFVILAAFSFSLIYLYRKRLNVFTNHGLALLIIWSVLLFIIYAFIINALPYQWYYSPFAIPLSIIFAMVLPQLLKSHLLKNIFITLLFLIACVLPIKNIIEGYNPKYVNFTNAVKWLNNNAPNGSLLGTDDIGILGYYYNKGKLVDALGLITSEASDHFSKREFDWFINTLKPDFIVNEYPNIQAYVRGNEKIFWENYETTKVFEARKEIIAIYKRKWWDSPPKADSYLSIYLCLLFGLTRMPICLSGKSDLPICVFISTINLKVNMQKKFWLVKSEPSEFSIDDLEKSKNQTTYWDGVRNYQARNYIRDEMKTGDKVLFYHSSTEPNAVVGVCEVVKEAYPDHTQFEAKHIHYDPRADKKNPTWFMVDIKLVKKFKKPVTLEEIKINPKMAKMRLVQRGNRLSVMRVTKEEFEEILKSSNLQ